MGFAHLGLDPLWNQSAKRRGFVTPTPIQRECIPAVLKGHDVLALSKTGTGKTLAYVLPILHKLQSADAGHKGPWSVLVLVPTKELILQVETATKDPSSGYTRCIGLRRISEDDASRRFRQRARFRLLSCPSYNRGREQRCGADCDLHASADFFLAAQHICFRWSMAGEH